MAAQGLIAPGPDMSRKSPYAVPARNEESRPYRWTSWGGVHVISVKPASRFVRPSPTVSTERPTMPGYATPRPCAFTRGSMMSWMVTMRTDSPGRATARSARSTSGSRRTGSRISSGSISSTPSRQRVVAPKRTSFTG